MVSKKSAYVGPSGWIGVVLGTKPDWTMIQQLSRVLCLATSSADIIVLSVDVMSSRVNGESSINMRGWWRD